MKEMNRRTFLKLSGASAVMLALAGCDDSCSSGSTSSGSATETPPSPPIPVIRDGQKILTIFNAELARRKVENIKFEYSKGLEHAIQADVQMFVDNGSPEFPAEEGLRLRIEGDYAAKMWEGLNEAGYSAGSTAIFGMLNQYRVGVDFDYEGKHLYSMDRLYPATEAQFQQLVDELIKDYGGVPGLHEDDPVVNKVGITVVDINDKTYWAAYIIDKWQGIGDG